MLPQHDFKKVKIKTLESSWRITGSECALTALHQICCNQSAAWNFPHVTFSLQLCVNLSLSYSSVLVKMSIYIPVLPISFSWCNVHVSAAQVWDAESFLRQHTGIFTHMLFSLAANDGICYFTCMNRLSRSTMHLFLCISKEFPSISFNFLWLIFRLFWCGSVSK